MHHLMILTYRMSGCSDMHVVQALCWQRTARTPAAGVSSCTELDVEVIGKAFGSFHGVVLALEEHFAAATKRRQRRR